MISTSNMTSPLRFLVVCCGEAEQVSTLMHVQFAVFV